MTPTTNGVTNDPMVATPSQATATILQNCVCIVLTCASIGTKRKVAIGDIKMERDGVELTDRQKRQLRMQKAIYESDDLASVRSVLSEAKAFVTARSASSHRVFGPGTRLIPLKLYGEVEQGLEDRKALLAERVAELKEKWPEIVAERKIKLGSLVDDGDFVSASDLVDEFELDWLPIQFSAPDRLKTVDEAAYVKSAERWEEKYRSAYDELILDARENALTILRETAERLSGTSPSGKPRALQPTALRDLQEMIALLPKKNVAGDDPLEDALSKVAALADGMSVETLNSAVGVRKMLAAETEKAIASLDSLVTEARTRAIKFKKATPDAA